MGGDSGPLSQATDLMAGDRDEIDIDLDEDSVVGMEPVVPDPPDPVLATPPAAAPRRARSASRSTAPPSAPAPAPPVPVPPRSTAPPPAPAPPVPVPLPAGEIDVEIDAGRVRKMLAEQPGLLEKGLGLHADEEGEPLGIDFPTPVGSIDLLGRDRKGGFVVVHVPSRDEVGESVSSMLRRMGWVRKHLVHSGEEVRGIVVVDHLPEDVAYAAAGVGNAIAFKSYRMALTFHDLER